MTERYSEDQFRDAYRRLRGVEAIDQSLLGTLLASTSANRQLKSIQTPTFVSSLLIRLEYASSQIGDVGQVLTDLDLEMRRAVAFHIDGTTRPLRERGSLTLLGTHRNSSTTIFVLASGSIHAALTKRPLDVVLAASWFWDHRVNRTKFRQPVAEEEYPKPLAQIIRSAQLAISDARPAVVALTIAANGETLFEFRPA